MAVGMAMAEPPELADLATLLKRRKGLAVILPIAAGAVRRIDAVFDAERASMAGPLPSA